MKNATKKILAVLSAAAMLTGGGSVVGVFANENPDLNIISPNSPKNELIYGYIVGEMTVGENGDVISSEDGELCLYKNDEAYVLSAEGEKKSFDDIKPGDKITYYVNGSAPMTLQLPVHYSPEVVVIDDEKSGTSRLISVFDENLLSADGDLILNVDPSIPYYSRTREAMLLSGKALVFYRTATRSIPAQTTPIAIVKLEDDPEAESGAVENEVVFGYVVGEMTVGENGDVISSEDGELCLYKNDAAYVLSSEGEKKSFNDIKPGDKITYYVNGSAPMTLQLPVHYSPEVVVIDDENSGTSRLISVFDENLLSADGELILHVDPSIPYYSRTREAMLLSGKALVFYRTATRSIPAQTTPIAIVKLEDDDEAQESAEPDLSGVKRFVIDSDMVVPHIPVTVQGIQMLPVRPLAEALGFKVDWDGETKSVTVGQASFRIDEDSYVFAKSAPRSLGQAPVLITIPGESFAQTYVPVSFFTDVLGLSISVDGDSANVNM